MKGRKADPTIPPQLCFEQFASRAAEQQSGPRSSGVVVFCEGCSGRPALCRTRGNCSEKVGSPKAFLSLPRPRGDAGREQSSPWDVLRRAEGPLAIAGRKEMACAASVAQEHRKMPRVLEEACRLSPFVSCMKMLEARVALRSFHGTSLPICSTRFEKIYSAQTHLWQAGWRIVHRALMSLSRTGSARTTNGIHDLVRPRTRTLGARCHVCSLPAALHSRNNFMPSHFMPATAATASSAKVWRQILYTYA